MSLVRPERISSPITIMAAVGFPMSLPFFMRFGPYTSGLMLFEPPLIRATLIRRYKRFLADVIMPDGSELTVHCANPGAMTGLKDEGLKIWVQDSMNPKRKLRYSWKLAELEGGAFAGIDTSVPNRVVGEALRAGEIAELSDYKTIKAEQKYGENSRIDYLLTEDGLPDLYLEIKNVHFLRAAPGLAEFPDSVTERGTKHLRELSEMARHGYRAVMFYFVQLTCCNTFALAADIDPAYATAFEHALKAGVEVLVYDTEITPEAINLRRRIPFN